ncbi:hypothetical protein ACWD3J_44395 [Streptomyces sp. NPDC002755]
MGEVRAARISVGVDAFPPVMPEKTAWTFDVDAFTHVLSIYGGHFLDVLFQIVGPPKNLTALTETQFPDLTRPAGPCGPPSPTRSWPSAPWRTAVCSRSSWKALRSSRRACRSTSPAPRASCGSPTNAPSRTPRTTPSTASTETAARPRSRCCPFPRNTGPSRTPHSTRACRTWPTCTPRSPATRRTAPPRRPRSPTPYGSTI